MGFLPCLKFSVSTVVQKMASGMYHEMRKKVRVHCTVDSDGVYTHSVGHLFANL